MTRKIFLGTALALLSACATIENESFSTINLNGRETDLRTRTMSNGSDSYVVHSVRSRNGTWRSCDPTSRGSCEAAVRSNAGGNSR